MGGDFIYGDGMKELQDFLAPTHQSVIGLEFPVMSIPSRPATPGPVSGCGELITNDLSLASRKQMRFSSTAYQAK